VLSKSRIFKFLKRDCGTINVAEITSGKIEFFSKHQRVVYFEYTIDFDNKKCNPGSF
jgi:hypothetical protein